MKFTTIAASLCVIGTASAFIAPVTVRSGVSTTRVQASIEETTAEKTKAREALIASADMAELLKLVGVDDTVEQAPTPAAPAAPATEELTPSIFWTVTDGGGGGGGGDGSGDVCRVPRRNCSLPQQLVVMKFSALFLLATLPSASVGFVLPGASPSLRPAGSASSGSVSASITRTSSPPSMMAESGGAKSGGDTSPWSVTAVWRDVVGSASQTKAKVDTTAADVYAELRKKVLVKQERQSLESQLCSLIRIEGDGMSCKAEEHVRRLASELEPLQGNAATFGSQRTGLAGCPGADGKVSRGSDRIKSIEDISYVSENCRISHTDTGSLRVYKRVSAPPRVAAAATASARAAAGDDTASAVVGGGGSGVGKAGRASATAAGRGGLRKQPLRKRMFFGWRRR
eukprot:jgi/Undpi1/10730/HiC_scaffold_29.g13178.m1